MTLRCAEKCVIVGPTCRVTSGLPEKCPGDGCDGVLRFRGLFWTGTVGNGMLVGPIDIQALYNEYIVRFGGLEVL